MATSGDDDVAFWAHAYYAPLAATLETFHAQHSVPHRFEYVMRRWWPVLQDGLAPPSRARPVCLAPYDEDDWFVQRFIMLYVCHTPYTRKRAPLDMQPFAGMISKYTERRGHFDTWLEERTDIEKRAWTDVLGALADPSQHSRLDAMRPFEWRGGWDATELVHDAVQAYDVTRATRLLNAPLSLSMHQQAWLCEYLRALQKDDKSNLGFLFSIKREGPFKAKHLAAMAHSSTRIAHEWMVLTARCTLSAWYALHGLWDDIGVALSVHSPARVSSLLVGLAEEETNMAVDLGCLTGKSGIVTELGIGQLVRTMCMPMFLSSIAERDTRGALSQSDTQWLCAFALRIIEMGYLDIRVTGKLQPFEKFSKEDADKAVSSMLRLAKANVEAARFLLRCTALQNSSNKYGAALYKALTHPPSDA